jgi:hypothetical protein
MSVGEPVKAGGEVVAEVRREQIRQELDVGLGLAQRLHHAVAAIIGIRRIRHERVHEPFKVSRRRRAALMHEELTRDTVPTPDVGMWPGGLHVIRRPGDDRPGAHDHVDEARIGEAGAHGRRDDVEEPSVDRRSFDQPGLFSGRAADPAQALLGAENWRHAAEHLVDAEQFEQHRIVGARADVVEIAA